MKFKFRFYYLIALGIIIILILVAIFINSTNAKIAFLPDTSLNISDFLRSLKICGDLHLPDLTLGFHVSSRTVDLDPTIPNDSKGSFLILLTNYEEINILFQDESQLVSYLKGLKNYCLLTTIPPSCIVGHYPGEPPGRKPCTYPTPSITP